MAIHYHKTFGELVLNTYEFIQIHSNIFVRSAYTSLAVRFGMDGHAYCNICEKFWDFVKFCLQIQINLSLIYKSLE